MAKKKTRSLPVIGWREWVSLPDLGVKRVKAKIDTGARSSSLHAFEVETFDRAGIEMVRFKIRPVQRSNKSETEVIAPVHDKRNVRSSSGKASVRVVIRTSVEIMGRTWLIDMTLANRDEMGFRMLLGREAIRNRLLVDAGKSFLGGKPKVIRKVK
ncbi:MAG: ATP-dependent zinc protease [Rhodothermales bacterium]|nr:ATP-dependent zinc protease [Rhodothermales bacterium]